MAYVVPSQAPKIGFFAKTSKIFNPIILFGKTSILEVWQRPK